MTEERVVDPKTGGMKGKKKARFSSIPPDIRWELAEHYGAGEAKYPNDPVTGKPNWQKGYDWALNVDALYRHMALWEMGVTLDTAIDPETGEPWSCVCGCPTSLPGLEEGTGGSHLIAVAWHAFTLRWFEKHDKGVDYRYPKRSLPGLIGMFTTDNPGLARSTAEDPCANGDHWEQDGICTDCLMRMPNA